MAAVLAHICGQCGEAVMGSDVLARVDELVAGGAGEAATHRLLGYSPPSTEQA